MTKEEIKRDYDIRTEKNVRVIFNRVRMLNKDSSNTTPFASFTITGGFDDCIIVEIYPDGWNGLGSTKRHVYKIWLKHFNEHEYRRLVNVLDFYIEKRKNNG